MSRGRYPVGQYHIYVCVASMGSGVRIAVTHALPLFYQDSNLNPEVRSP